MFYVYIIYADDFDSFYIGYSADVDTRLQQHNAGLFIIKSKTARSLSRRAVEIMEGNWLLYLHNLLSLNFTIQA